MTRRWIVREGQRYVQRPGASSRPAIWEVGSIKAGAATILHARLIKVDDPLHSKTISCDTLADPAFYVLLADAQVRA